MVTERSSTVAHSETSENKTLVQQSFDRWQAGTGSPFDLLDARRDAAWRARLAPLYRELGLSPDLLPPPMDLPPFGPALCEVVEQTRPEVVSFHFGLPERLLLDRVKRAECTILSSATTVAEACWLEANGVDAVIAEGNEAGGHRATL